MIEETYKCRGMLQVIFLFTLLGAGNTSWCPSLTEITDYSGIFSTPFHSSFYPTDTKCVWKLTAPLNLHIKLSFRTFHLEDCANCACDSVTVYDVTQHNKNVTLGKYCGRNKPGLLYSSGRQMTVVFISDHGDSASGFLAEYEAIQKGKVCKPEPYVITNEGAITSPNFSSAYPSNIRCIWIIQAKPTSRIKLKFLSFNVENCSAAPGRCQCDFIEVRDGNSSSSILIGRFCGKNTPPIVYSSGMYLWVKFRSDNQVNKRGFLAQFSTHKQDKNSCPADSKYPFQCPKDRWSRMKNISQVCCYDNQADCCKPGGSYCSDSGVSRRNYCPRTKDDGKLSRCCVKKGEPSCCLAAANILHINRFELLAVASLTLTLILIIR